MAWVLNQLGIGPFPLKERKTIAFVVYPGVSPLDLVGPLTVLRDLALDSPLRTVVVAEEVGATATDSGLQIVPAKGFAEVPAPYALVIAGGGAGTLAATESAALLNYVRSAGASARVIGATGNGSLVLAAAGLLTGRRTAIHWAYKDLLTQLGARYEEGRWVEDGKFMTAAGGSAGIDMMLRFVYRLRGIKRARLAQLVVEYDPRPPYGRVHETRKEAYLASILGVPLPGRLEAVL